MDIIRFDDVLGHLYSLARLFGKRTPQQTNISYSRVICLGNTIQSIELLNWRYNSSYTSST